MIDSKQQKRQALGRGLGALIPGGSPSERKGIMNLPIEDIIPDRAQPRRHFDEVHIEELAESIRNKGVLLPLIVRRTEKGYLLIAGERRWRAAQKAGLRELPVLVREVTEVEAFELALIENIQREDLNPIEEAEAYRRLIDDHGLTQDQLGQRLGKDRSTITNSLRLLRLPEQIKLSIMSGQLSMSHARALLGLTEGEDLEKVAAKVIQEELSVRAVEQLVQRFKSKRAGGKENRGEANNVQLRHMVEKLQRKLGTKAELKDRGGAGSLEIRYANHQELERIFAAILGDS